MPAFSLSRRRLMMAIFILIVCSGTGLLAQPHKPLQPKQPNSAEIGRMIKRLNVLGSALYVAAHPDDENTRMIAWLANERLVETTYLSLTRGDGGQNLIGPEIRDQLGVLRTQELLMARSVDGGQQRFSRAVDFGYSKTPEETFAIWDRDAVLSDMVRVIRQTKPDIIITRFNPERTRSTHGHHTASAMLAVEAFKIAGDLEAYPDQLARDSTWIPSRIYFNTSWWFYGSREAFAEADKSDMLAVDVGAWYPHLGKSNNEIAAESRSMHRCQGFGSTGVRGSQLEWLKLIGTHLPPEPLLQHTGGEADPFAGLNLSWTRVPEGKTVGKLLDKAIREYNPMRPALSVPALVNVYSAMEKLPDHAWKVAKLAECRDVIAACLGLYLEAVTDKYWVAPGDSVLLDIELTNRSDRSVWVRSLELLPATAIGKPRGMNPLIRVFGGDEGGEAGDPAPGLELGNNRSETVKMAWRTPDDALPTSPYWLNEEGTDGLFTVSDPDLIGLPETPRPLRVRAVLQVSGRELPFEFDAVYKRNDPVMGETYRPFEIVPPVFLDLDEPVYLFADDQAREIELRVKAGADGVNGRIRLLTPEGWQVQPEFHSCDLTRAEEEQRLTFTVIPPAQASEGWLRPMLSLGRAGYSKGLDLIEYDHVPTQTVVTETRSKLVRVALQNTARRIGYVEGAGDAVPESLRSIGCDVNVLGMDDLARSELDEYDAIVLGIRALNTQKELRFHLPALFDYAQSGGTLLMQYNTAHRLVTQDLAPYALQLSRGRVTDETAPVDIIAPDHPAMKKPNAIGAADFEGWVQERGLYFPESWGEEFIPLLSMADPDEDALTGSLLVAQHGEGWIVYTGLSFFRELPAGVAGAYRLFANLISLGATDDAESQAKQTDSQLKSQPGKP